jgi:hypothetical protein
MLKVSAERSEWMEGGNVSVKIDRTLPVSLSSRPSNEQSVATLVRDAWLEHHWKRGGGLPILVSPGKIHNDDNMEGSKRTIVPIMMEEMITSAEADGSSCMLQYTVTKPGPFFQADLVPDSHSGTVMFQSLADKSGDNQCRMTWEVEFESSRLKELYQALTEFTVGAAVQTVAEAVAPPRKFTLQTTLEMKNAMVENPFSEAQNIWLDFVWDKGGGLPLLPAVHLGETLQNGGGTVPKTVLRISPFLLESVRETPTGADGASIIYQMENPGWLAFPFLVHSQLGRIQFLRSKQQLSSKGNKLVEVVWEVELRPFSFMAPVVEKLTEMTVSTIARNLRVHVLEPDAFVAIKAPRGQKISENLESFGSVSKDSWVGGVLDAHLHDSRSTWEQTMAIFLPWTWGRSGNGSEQDDVQFRWNDGHIQL